MMRRGKEPFRGGLLRRRMPTVREWCAYWLAIDVAKREKSRREDASSLETHVFPTLGDARLDRVTRHDVHVLVAKWASDAMPRTVRRRYAVLRAAMNAAVAAELIDRSPCREIRMPRNAPARAYALTPEEVALLASETGRRYAPMVFTAAMLGLRFCECAGLRIGRLDLDHGTMSVAEGLVEAGDGKIYSNPPKSRAGRRTMHIPTSLITMLDEHLDTMCVDRGDEEALVFTSPTGGPLRYSNFRKRVWYGAVERSGLPAIGFHDLRRTAATVLVSNRVDLKTAQVRLGHANPLLTLQVYAQATTDQDREAAALIDAHFSSVIDQGATGSGPMTDVEERRPS